YSILTWWFTIFIIGVLALPFIFTLFNKFWDKGYIFSKIFSLITLTYLILILGIFKILPFTLLSLVFLGTVFLFLNLLFLRQKKRISLFIEMIKKNYKIFLFQELLFLILLTVWSFVRGFAPNIEGLEKYMDWGFINSALRSHFLPPQDMWFAGLSINYYYFGHLIFALITKLSQISSTITYNLSIATVFSLTFLSSFSLASNIVFSFFKKIKFQKIVLAGLISAVVLTFGGNLHSVYKIIKLNFGQNNNHLNFSQEALTKSIDSYWYPDATRFIGHDPDTKDKTIHEFPIYSFVVADLHGHMNDIPIVLFFLATLFTLITASPIKVNWLSSLLFGFILSVCYMTNAWDFAVYGLFFAVFTFLINFSRDGPNSLIKTILNGGLVIIFWYLFSLPFSLNFVPMMEGIRFSDSHTNFYQLFILYGGFWIISLPFFIYFIIKRPKHHSDYFIFSLVLVATILVLIPEIFYIKDIYIYEYRRANTMFKLVYQAFILYSLSSGYFLIRFSHFLKHKILEFLYKIIFSIILVIHLFYPYFAIKSFYGSKSYLGLNGLNYLKDFYPDNFNAINWINKNISGQPVMLEAVGDSYTTFNQISSATGLPTIEGWIVHEWLWRGGYDQPSKRQQEVTTIYESSDLEEIKKILEKYQVKYLFVGSKEYEKYPKLDKNKFEKIGGEVVFESGKTTIYRL
ncbi:MAG: DUF2298 domain-containing protein, partial [Candidatus Shapirobacteria bacterium]|nr:DUF2298 domain-containing protein [Candidatus Shapirobacteria bacterium]